MWKKHENLGKVSKTKAQSEPPGKRKSTVSSGERALLTGLSALTDTTVVGMGRGWEDTGAMLPVRVNS